MTSEPPFPFPQLVDSTMISCFDACEQKWCYEFGHHLSPLAINPDLHAGGAFSRGIEVVRTGLYKHNLPVEEALTTGVRAMFEFWGDFEPPPKNPKNLIAMVGALDDYFREYPPEIESYKPYMLKDGSPAVEFSMSIPSQITHPTNGEPIIYAGRFDMLATYEDLFLCIVDEKTTTSFYGDWSSVWGMRGQFMGYCFGAQYYGYDVNTAVIRGIGILKTKYNHLQIVEEYPQWQIDRWWKRTNKKIQRMVTAWEENDWELSYGDGCSAYGGCTFIPLCVSEVPENSFSNYQRRVWNPLEKDPTWPIGGPQYETLGTLEELMKGS